MEIRRVTGNIPDSLAIGLRRMGEDISAARRARRISQADMAEKVAVSRKTISAIERGDPKVAFGTYAEVAWIMGLENSLLSAFAPSGDPVALREARLNLPERVRKTKPGTSGLGDLDF